MQHEASCLKVAAMEAAAVTEDAATTTVLNETESAAAAAGCQFGGDPTWHATFTWWMDGIAMLMVGESHTLARNLVHPANLQYKQLRKYINKVHVVFVKWDTVKFPIDP